MATDLVEVLCPSPLLYALLPFAPHALLVSPLLCLLQALLRLLRLLSQPTPREGTQAALETAPPRSNPTICTTPPHTNEGAARMEVVPNTLTRTRARGRAHAYSKQADTEQPLSARLARSDPARVRARVLRAAREPIPDMRTRAHI